MSKLMKSNACFCTAMPCQDEPIEPDVFCQTCEGTGKIERSYSLIEKLMLRTQARHDKTYGSDIANEQVQGQAYEQ